MEARAIRKHIRSSPRKMRTVVNLVRGKRVSEALNILHFMPQKATRPVELAIQSAVHNLMDRFKDERVDVDELVIREIKVDEGAQFGRFRPVSRGRAHPIIKRSSHLTVVIGAPVVQNGTTEEAAAAEG
jgi:large subunit ribosomal protein L22